MKILLSTPVYDSFNQIQAKPLGEKVKENVKTTSYLGVIVLGVGVTAIMFYSIFSELFSSTSPQAIYAEAFDKCKDDTRVQVLTTLK